VRLLDVGFESVVVETPGGIIFRVGRTRAAAEGHRFEWGMLRKLRLPVAVPRPQWRVEPGEKEFPFGALGHQKIPGRTLVAGDRVAADLAAVLRTLHTLQPPTGALHVASWREQLRELEDLLPVLREHLGAELDIWWQDAVSDAIMSTHPHVLIHRDLWYENVLVDEEPPRVVGILDWSAAGVGDPAEDLAPQFYLGESFAQEVLTAYGADDAMRHRVARRRVVREFTGIRWALEQDDEVEFTESIEKLRRELAREAG